MCVHVRIKAPSFQLCGPQIRVQPRCLNPTWWWPAGAAPRPDLDGIVLPLPPLQHLYSQRMAQAATPPASPTARDPALAEGAQREM